MNFSEALKELRKQKKRNFNQSLDLIINLKDFDIKRETLNTFVVLLHIGKRAKVCAFLEHPSKSADYVITKNNLEKISQGEIKKLTKSYDFFIANAKLMPTIASKFGKVLGTVGKMPDPKLGCVLAEENESVIAEAVERLSKTVKIKAKEPSIKVALGKESMSDAELVENASAVLNVVVKALPKKELNIKSVLLKFTMSPAIKIKK